MPQATQEISEAAVTNDPNARALLQKAFENTARWPADFGGFTANLEVNTNGTKSQGTVTVNNAKEVSVSLPDTDLQKSVEGTVGMIVVHRAHRTFDEADGKYTLTLEGDANHPFGQRLRIHGDNSSSFYYLKDNRITQINRTMQHIAFTINVEESAVTPEGKNLTIKYTVYYLSPKDGSLRNVESVTDTHVRIGTADLPATRRIISYENKQIVTKTLTFTNHKLA
tara:strand:- start:278 stop:952 length:675 start_codon:yes stop_codon:yes gene_type:complete